jgi:hemolysin D
MKLRSKELHDFLPGALLIQERPPKKWPRVTAYLIALLMTSGLTWASIGEVDIVARASGKVIPTGQTKRVQSSITGKIDAIHITNGDEVQAGETLIELDATEPFNQLQQRLEQHEFKQHEIERTRHFAEYLEKGNVKQLSSSNPQQALFSEQIESYTKKIEQLNAQLRSSELSHSQAKTQLDSMSQLHSIVEAETEAIESLVNNGAASKSALLTQRQRLIEVEASVRALQLDVASTLSQAVSIQKQTQAFKAESRAQTLNELLRLQEAARVLNGDITQLEWFIEQHNIRAPIDGIVSDLNAFTVGAVATSAETLMNLVPLNQSLRVEAWLQNSDVGFVETGQRAEVKVDAFSFTKYGVIDAEIIHLGADAQQNEQGILLFPAELKLFSETLEIDGTTHTLQPGMTVSAELKTGKRRIIEYLLSPLLRMKTDSIEER